MLVEEKLWDTLLRNKRSRLERASHITDSKIVRNDDVVRLFEAVIESGDKVCVEGNNQKHADFLSEQLTLVDPGKINGLHIVQSNIALATHLDIFEKGIAKKLDFCGNNKGKTDILPLVHLTTALTLERGRCQKAPSICRTVRTLLRLEIAT